MWIKPIAPLVPAAPQTAAAVVAEGFATRIRNSGLEVDGLTAASLTAVSKGTAGSADVARLREFCRDNRI